MKISMSMFSKIAVGLFMSAVIVEGSAQAASVCYDCTPQCVTYAKDRAGIGGSCGNAGNMNCSGAKKVSTLQKGDMIEISSPGHVMYVEKADKKKCKDSKCDIKISDANWQSGCNKKNPKKCPVNTNISGSINKNKVTVSGRGTYSIKAIWRKK